MSKAKSKSKPKPLSRRPIPTGLRPPAQGCEARATLGKPSRVSTNPNGVVATARTCIHCGCNDANDIRPEFNRSWIQLHKHTRTGVCSNCYTAALADLTDAINQSEEPVFATSRVYTPPELSAAIKSLYVSAS